MNKQKPLAILVSNQREFDALMKHYEEKSWAAHDNDMEYNQHIDYWKIVEYKNKWSRYTTIEAAGKNDYEVLSFQNFLLLTNLCLPTEEHLHSQGISVKITPEAILIDNRISFTPGFLDAVHEKSVSMRDLEM